MRVLHRVLFGEGGGDFLSRALGVGFSFGILIELYPAGRLVPK